MGVQLRDVYNSRVPLIAAIWCAERCVVQAKHWIVFGRFKLDFRAALFAFRLIAEMTTATVVQNDKTMIAITAYLAGRTGDRNSDGWLATSGRYRIRLTLLDEHDIA